jgi:type I restriction-modification system DNA methylase subunit
MNIDFAINHIRNRSYMSGVEREKLRVKKTGEVFTPTETVQKLIKLKSVDQQLFSDPQQVFIDPAGCGDGQFLGEVLIRKLENGIDFETALSTIYGVDLMSDNILLCQERLLCGREDLRHIVEQNIVCADALRYHYRFDSSHPYDDESKEMQKEQLWNNLFDEKG